MTSHRSIVATAAAVALHFVSTSEARADARCNKKTDPVYVTAKPHFDEGVRLFGEGESKNDASLIESARRQFLLAYRACATVGVTFNLAQVEFAQKHPLAAMRYLREAVRIHEGTQPSAADGDPEFAESFASLWRSVYPVTGHLVIDATADAQVFVDGNELPGRAPLVDTVDLDPGVHTIEARLGSERGTRSVSLPAGQDVRVAIALPKDVVVKTVDIEAATRTKVIVVSALATLGVAGWASGFYFASKGAGAQSDSDAVRANVSGHCSGVSTGDCGRLAQFRDDKNQDKTLGIVSFVGGTAFLGAAVLTGLLWHPAGSEGPQARVVPTFGPGHVGLNVTNHF